ncbi:PREDICTED: prolyl 3-hydroxylase OGFOD1 [Dinoponera quadriceps]|uniref:uS12 prolyl 3-hydroxylase n=1 Tax=Dinoponera quadriceps TaxID=609295 RepID=A0A6P3YAK1_DINQU|nr:PREDICTED: prolyl 3-hydroxylase OGFOD1 [Dinoponera quadriceps]XP_014486993.1 PREDICTED: prolyl 3-hydroxylase OGFOD1 [Dinoponera quadriceps]
MADTQPDEHSLLSKHVICSKFQETFSKHWHSFSDLKTTDIEFMTKPFRICKISNFVRDEDFLQKVREELLNMKFKRKVVDLYQFKQTVDLSIIESEYVNELRDVFRDDVALWMKRNTGITLNEKLSMSGSMYFDTDHLLCHDDNLQDRRIAFILYLMDEWSVEDGGALDLFDTDENGCPRDVVRSIVPEYNSFVFFEVVDNSYHQVAEIMAKKKIRWSINGWFHGPKRNAHRPPRPIQTMDFIEPNEETVDLDLWISENYLTSTIARQIQEIVEDNSYILLQGFLKQDLYEAISADLTSQDIQWRIVGPADERRYEVADEQTLPYLLKEFYNIFKSISFFKQLKDYTELDLSPDDESMKPKMTIELQRWSQGCYTLIVDRTDSTNANENESAVSSTDNEIDNTKRVTLRSQKRKLGTQSPNESKVARLESSDDSSYSMESEPSSMDSDDSADKKEGEEKEDGEEVEGDKENSEESGELDLIIQFHTSDKKELKDVIDYVDPLEPNGELVHVPMKDNHLCLVYKSPSICRVHHYVNHYCKGYFYNLICTYHQ